MLAPSVSFAEMKQHNNAPATAEKSQTTEVSKAPGSGPNPYVECGIGAALFPTISWAAVTSNVIWDAGITALTSAVSSPQTCNAKKAQTARLILETLPALEKDVSMGKGQYLTALMNTAGCNQASSAQITTDMRASYSNVVSAPEYASQSRVDKAAAFYDSARSAMNGAACNVTL